MFFGSLDAANLITVDKPPALAVGDGALRPGSSASTPGRILVPQALDGRRRRRAAVRRRCERWYGAAAGLIAGAVLALTPVAALMFRFNNPDALLVLLLAPAAYALVRALEAGAHAGGSSPPARSSGSPS